MHNHWNPVSCPPPHRPEDGEPIVGKIIDGKTYPYGCVTTASYNVDKAALDERISDLEDQLSTKCNVRIQETEPIENGVLWIRPVETGIAPLVLGENTGEDGILVSSNGSTKKALNVVENEADLSPGNYCFEINRK